MLVFLLTFIGLAAANQSVSISDIDTTGFLNPTISLSAGGHAICVSGLVTVPISNTSTVKLQLPDQFNQFEATQLILDLESVQSSAASRLIGVKALITEDFNISSQLCYPRGLANLQNITTVQFLTHGIGFSKTYWDFAAPDNSYIDTAALAGKVTFAYDRLGIEGSTQPNPIQIVQGSTEIAVAHSLITLLRNGQLAATSFNNIIGVGHSYGSAITASIASRYPSDLNAVVATGFSTSNTGLNRFTSALNLIPAASSPSGRFPNLADGYLLPSTLDGIQYSFFHFPGFETDLLLRTFATIQPTSIGEQLTMDVLTDPAPQFTSPVYVVNGQFDVAFCDGNCSFPVDIPAQTLKEAFPNADASASSSLIVRGAGHGLNLGTTAPTVFSQIQAFISKSGF